MLEGEQPELAVTDAVLTAARSPGGYSELRDCPAKLLGAANLIRRRLIDENKQMEVTVPNVSCERSNQPRL